MKLFKPSIWLFFFFPLLFQNCKKSTSTVLDGGTSAAGTYSLSHFALGTANYSLPSILGPDTVSGTVKVSEINSTTIKLLYNIRKGPNNIANDTSGTVNLSDDGSQTYSMTSPTYGNLGTIGKNVININGRIKTQTIQATGKKPTN